MKNFARIIIITLSIIGCCSYAHAEEPSEMEVIRQLYRVQSKPRLDSIKANYEVISNVSSLDEGFKDLINAFESLNESSEESSDSDLIITLTADEQVLIDFLNFGCGLNFGFRRCGYFFKPDIPELCEWYKKNSKYITDWQLKEYCDLKAEIELYEINKETSFLREFTNKCLSKEYWLTALEFEDEEPKNYYRNTVKLEKLKAKFLARQYDVVESRK